MNSPQCDLQTLSIPSEKASKLVCKCRQTEWYKQKGLEEEEDIQRTDATKLQNFLWNHRDRDPMELAKQKTYTSGNRIQSPGTHNPGLLMRNTSVISAEEPFYKTLVLKAVKVLKTREVGKTAQPGGALREKKTKCNVGS